MAEVRETILVRQLRRKYNWPEAQLNFWLIIMIAAGATELGIFGYFFTVQNTFGRGIPWYVHALNT